MKLRQIKRAGGLTGGTILLLLMWYGAWSYSGSLVKINEAFMGLVIMIGLLVFFAGSVWFLKHRAFSKKVIWGLFGFALLTGAWIWAHLSWEDWTPLQGLAPNEELTLVLQSENHPESLGYEVWFESLTVNGESVPLADWIQHDGWFKVEMGYAPHNTENAVLYLNPIKGQQVTFNFLKTPYSGQVALYRNGEFVELFDLYAGSEETLHYQFETETGLAFGVAKLGMAVFIVTTQSVLFIWVYFLLSLIITQRSVLQMQCMKWNVLSRRWLKDQLNRTSSFIQQYRRLIIAMALIYGLLTFIENVSPFSLWINLGLTLLLLGITGWICRFAASVLDKTSVRLKRSLPFLAILLYLGLKQNQLWILHPIDELVRPYDLVFTATGEKSADSMGAEVWISKILINGEAVPLTTFCESGEWSLQGDAIVNAQLPAAVTLSSLRGEQVVVEFVKSAYSGQVNILRSPSTLKSVDLHRTLSTYVQYKVTPDYFILLGAAKLIMWGWLTWMLASCYVILCCGIQRAFSKLSPSLRQSKMYQTLKSLLDKPSLQKIASGLHSQVKESHLLTGGIEYWGYLALPFVLLAVFRYLGNWNFQSEAMGYGIFFAGAIVLERIWRRVLTRQPDASERKQTLNWAHLGFYSVWWSLLLMIVLGLIYHMPDVDVAWFWMETKVEAIIMVVTLLVSLIGVGYAIIHHAPLTIGMLFASFCCLGIADYFKRLVAGEPLYPADLAMITKLDTLIGFLNGVSPTFVFSSIGSLIIGLGLLAYFVRGPKTTWKMRGTILLVTGIYSLAFFNYGTSFLKTYVKGTTYIETWNQIQNYDDNGVVIGFISNLQNDSMMKPDNYSQSVIEAIVEQRIETLQSKTESPTTVRPNVVVVLSESLGDPLQMNQLSFSEDPIPTIRAYQTQGISGHFLSPFKGGSTSNVEFEFLTSFTNLFLTKGSVPFQQRLSTTKDFPSVVSYLNGLGYTSVAIHPSNPSFYKRNKVYPNLGFDTFIGIDEMTYTERIANQSFISDESMMNELLQVLKTESNPAFAYGLTIQNHLPLEENKFGPTTIEVLDSSGERVSEMETYAQGVKMSDESLKYLLEELEAFEEPTVVIFFGDHLINFESSIYQDHGYSYADKDGETAKLFFQTPLLIWANEDILLPQAVTSISPNFLIPLTLQALNLPLTPYYQLLLEVYEEFGALHRDFKLDRDEQVIATLSEKQEELLLEYELIQYDLMQGKGYALEKMFTPINSQ